METQRRNSNSRNLLLLLIKAIVTFYVSSFFFILAVAATSILLLLMLCLAGTSSTRRRGRFPNPEDSEHAGGCSLQDLRRLLRMEFKHDSTKSAEDCKCVVCLSSLKEGERCGHQFHVDCIDRWLIRKPFCPICRRQVRLGGNMEEHHHRRRRRLHEQQLRAAIHVK